MRQIGAYTLLPAKELGLDQETCKIIAESLNFDERVKFYFKPFYEDSEDYWTFGYKMNIEKLIEIYEQSLENNGGKRRFISYANDPLRED